MLGIKIYRDHVISRHEELRHPEKNAMLYSISGLKDALDPPLITSQREAIEYIQKMEPYDADDRINAWGHRRKDYRKTYHRKRRESTYMEDKYGSYET